VTVAWVERTIGDIADVYDGPHATPASSKTALIGPVFLGISSLQDGRLDLAQSPCLNEMEFDRWTRRVTPKPGDVVFSYETRLGQAAIIPEGLRCCLGRRLALIRVDRTQVDPRFLLYTYLGPEFQETIRKNTVQGSTVDRIMLRDFPSFPVRLPPLTEQRAIAATLGALDDKIDSNRRVIQTGWALLAAEYRALQAQAPVIPLGNILDLAYGRALPADNREPGDVPVYGSNGVTGYHTSAFVSAPAVVVGRKGSVGEIHWSSAPCWPIDTTFYVQPRNGVPPLISYFALKSAGLTAMNSDSAIPGLNRVAALAVQVPIPATAKGVQWAATRQPLLDVIDQRQSETVRLAALRDALLPELLSGRLRATAS